MQKVVLKFTFKLVISETNSTVVLNDVIFLYNFTKNRLFSIFMILNRLFQFFYCWYVHRLQKMSRKSFPIQKFAEKILVSREQLKMIFSALVFTKFMGRALVKKSASKSMNLFRLIVIVWIRWDSKNQSSKSFWKKNFVSKNVFARKNRTLLLGSYLCKNGRRYRWSFLSSAKA